MKSKRQRNRHTSRRRHRPQLSNLLWHYTTGDKFKLIDADGALRPTAVLITPGERPALWFSSEQYWEPTANKGRLRPDGTSVRLDMRGTLEHGNGLVRIGVTRGVARHPWRDFKRMSGVLPAIAAGLEKVGKEQGAAPYRWYVSFKPVLRDQWSAVEIFDNGRWVPHPMLRPDALAICRARRGFGLDLDDVEYPLTEPAAESLPAPSPDDGRERRADARPQ